MVKITKKWNVGSIDNNRNIGKIEQIGNIENKGSKGKLKKMWKIG